MTLISKTKNSSFSSLKFISLDLQKDVKIHFSQLFKCRSKLMITREESEG